MYVRTLKAASRACKTEYAYAGCIKLADDPATCQVTSGLRAALTKRELQVPSHTYTLLNGMCTACTTLYHVSVQPTSMAHAWYL